MAESLKLKGVHLYPLENGEAHRTDKYELVHDENPTPVLRRGQKFSMALRFLGRSFVKTQDIVRLIFNFGANPNPTKHTKGVIRIDPGNKTGEVDKNNWSGSILSEQPDSLILEVYSPPDIPVGNWSLQVETRILQSTSPANMFEYENDVFFLFNPWICEDLTYMPEQRLLDEYVLTDVGKIWVGPFGTSRGREWVYGQFDKTVLGAAMLVLYRSNMNDASRGDPIRTSRVISKMVNSNDDDGVLVGRWDGEYADGTAPAAWTGSVEILEEFLETQQPVSYGQCWVFSGVVATICRALGLPCRVVTNLVSAHDANASLTVDKYYDVDNVELEFDPKNAMGEDSIWNYHVWNDVWMARPDLPSGYGGWQAIDSTPQETSDGMYQCGPSSLEAIRNGQVGFNYDVAFMVASVNADLARWKQDSPDGDTYTRIYCDKYHIGRMIITKQPFIYDPNGDKDREDITHLYKAKEGTNDERLSLLRAVRGTETAKSFYSVPDRVNEDVLFELVDLEQIKIGEDFDVRVNIKNTSNEVRTIKAVLSTSSVFYTGVKAHFVRKAEGSFTMEPNTSDYLSMTVSADQYLDKLVEYCIMKIYAIATIDETKQTWAEEDDFQVTKPSIEIQMPKAIPIGKPTKVVLHFKNPLKKVLTDCTFRLSGPSLMKKQVIPYPDVKPEGLVKTEVEIAPKMSGDQKIVVAFSAKQLVDITGTAKIEVFDDEE